MRNWMYLFLILALYPACDEDCAVPHNSYEWNTIIDGESRRAIIWKPTNECITAPVLIYFHGRGGDAEDSQSKRGFHDLMKSSYVVYAEGTNFDGDPEGKFGWEIRFPHINTYCDYDKDLKYLDALLDHLEGDPQVNMDRIGVSGHSSGGFFTLSLAELRPQTFAGFASLGAYSSYYPDYDLVVCTNTYVSGIHKGNASADNAQIAFKPAPTFYMFGIYDSTLHGNVSTVYKPDCSEFSYFQNTVLQLVKKNGSILPGCRNENFMTDLDRQVFEAQNQHSAETQVHIYDDDHSWPVEANQWVADYFADLLYY